MPAAKNPDSDWIKSAVIYQIYPLSFNHAPSASDPHKGAYGNLNGITKKVDYIASLGVDAAWLCPFFASPLQTGFGYNVTDYQKVGETFGTQDDFHKMVEAFHRKGIKVIVDQVYNHTDREHPWFEASRNPQHPDHDTYKDFYIWADARGTDGNGQPIPPNNWGSIMSKVPGAWEWDDKRRQFYMHSFDQRMPDLNINNPKVRQAIVDNARFWLDEGVDGFRLDAVCHYGHDHQLRNNPLTDEAAPFDKQNNPQRLLYNVNQPAGTEMLRQLHELVESYPSRWINGGQPYKPALLSEFNFDKGPDANKAGEALVSAGPCHTFYTAALRDGPGEGRGLHSFRQDVEEMLRLSPDGSRINWAMSNHDMERVLTRWFGKDATEHHAKLCLSLLTALPGSICLYQGEELGLHNPHVDEVRRSELNGYDLLGLSTDARFPWDAARAPMPFHGNGKEEQMWLKLPEAHKTRSVAIQHRDRQSVLNHAREAISLRKRTPALRDPGSLTFINTTDPHIVAFTRQSNLTHQQMLCAFNFTDKAASVTLPAGVQPIGSNGAATDGVVTVKPFESQFVELAAPMVRQTDLAAQIPGQMAM